MLAFGGIIADFVEDSFATIFVKLLDGAVYRILAYVYRIWVGITQLDLFGSSEAGKLLYTEFTSRIYTIISVIMVFIFAYRLLMRVVDPDGSYSPKESAWSFIKKVLFSVILVIVAPLLFRYMSTFQSDIVTENTIINIVLGTSGGSNKLDSGKQLSMITLMGFYHPEDTTYNTFVVDANADSCDSIIVPKEDLANDIQKTWRDRMHEWCEDDDLITPAPILNDKPLRKAIGDEGGTEYFWIVCTACGCLVIYFLVSYCISIGTRAVRLGFLEIIAPIPILLRMFGPEKYFTPWFNELKNTYLELFVRIAIIAFVIYLCTLVPTFIDLIAGAF